MAMVVQKAAKRVRESSYAERIIATALSGLLVGGIAGGILMYRELGEVRTAVASMEGDVSRMRSFMLTLEQRIYESGRTPEE